MTQSLVTIADIPITIVKKRVKNINLRISRQGVVSVSAPQRCSQSAILQFLHQKETWIKTHVDMLKKQADKQAEPLSFCWFLGQRYPLKIQEHHETIVKLEDNHIVCCVKPRATEKTIQRVLLNWHRVRMEILLPDLISKWEERIGVRVYEWTLKTMISRWGSCHPKQQRICLNLNLIQKPLECLEYVLVHEMVHILEASHNQRFHALMTRFMPEWRAYKRILAEF